MFTTHRRALVGAALLAAAIGVTVPVTAATASATPAPATVRHDISAITALHTASYWTPARLRAAKDADTVNATPAQAAAAAKASVAIGRPGVLPGVAPSVRPSPASGATPAGVVRPDGGPLGSPWTGSRYIPPATTTGKVFFTTHNGEGWQCSASAVNSAGKDMIFTAGHCVYGSMGGDVPGEGWHGNWEFIPDYNNGSAPYGVWTAKSLTVLTAYYDNQDLPDDMGAVTANTNSSGAHLVNVVGGMGFAWNWPANEAVYDFGYPAAAPFNGLVLDYCNGNEFNSPVVSGTIGLVCNFTGGSSGGPWLAFFGGEFGDVNGVNSYSASGYYGDIFSPYFGNNADTLFNAVANS